MRDYQKYTDEELFGLLSSDDEKAFEEIYKRYWPKLLGSAFKRIKDFELAREIVQDIFTELWVHRHERKILTSPLGYLKTAVRYRVLNLIEKETVRANYQTAFYESAPVSENPTEDTIFLKELAGRLDFLTRTLPPQCRRVFELSRYEYKNNREIAAQLDISEKTVENHLTKALRILKENLRDLALLLFLFFCTK